MAVTKREDDGDHPAGHYLYVPDSESPSTWKLRVKDVNGELDPRLLGAAQAALTVGYRGQRVDIPPDEKRGVAAKLVRLMREIDQEPSDALLRLAGMTESTSRHIRPAKIFEAGRYPERGVEYTVADLRRLVENSPAEIPISVGHLIPGEENPLDLGIARNLRVIGTELWADLEFTPAGWELAQRSRAQRLSVCFDAENMLLREVSLVTHPRVPDARVRMAGLETFDMSLDMQASAVRRAVQNAYGEMTWCSEVFDDYVIIETEDNSIYSVSYSIDETGAVVLGERVPVTREYRPKPLTDRRETELNMDGDTEAGLTILQKLGRFFGAGGSEVPDPEQVPPNTEEKHEVEVLREQLAEVQAKMATLAAENEAVKAQLAAMPTEHAEAFRDRMKAAGKWLPTDEAMYERFANDVTWRASIEKRPSSVLFSRLTKASAMVEGGVDLTPEELLFCERHHIDPQKYVNGKRMPEEHPERFTVRGVR